MNGTYDSHAARSSHAAMKLDSASAAGMWPVLRPGDELTYTPSPAVVRVGELLVTADGVQRLVWIDPFERLWTCADGMGHAPVRRDKTEVLGVAIAVSRDGKHIPLQSKRPSLAVYVELGLSVIARRRSPSTPA